MKTTILFVAASVVTEVASAGISLEFRPVNETIVVGETLELGFYAVSDNDQSMQTFSAIQAIFEWESSFLQLQGLDETGSVDLLSSGFSADDPFGLNETVPPQDGDGFYLALAFLGEPVTATPEGTFVTTFEFTALSAVDLTSIDLLESGGDPEGETIVFDGTVPNLDVTGDLLGAYVSIVDVPAPGVFFGLFAAAPALVGRRSRRTRSDVSEVRRT